MDQFSSKLTTSSAFLHTKVLSTEGSRPPSASFSLCGLISPDNDFLFCVLEKSAHTCNLNTPFNHCFFFPWAHLVLILQPCPRPCVCPDSTWKLHGVSDRCTLFQTPWASRCYNSLLLQCVSHGGTSPRDTVTLQGVTTPSSAGGGPQGSLLDTALLLPALDVAQQWAPCGKQKSQVQYETQTML